MNEGNKKEPEPAPQEIAAVSAWLKKTYQLPENPPSHIVEAICRNARAGLTAFVEGLKGKLGGKEHNEIRRHESRVADILRDARKQSGKIFEKKLPINKELPLPEEARVDAALEKLRAEGALVEIEAGNVHSKNEAILIPNAHEGDDRAECATEVNEWSHFVFCVLHELETHHARSPIIRENLLIDKGPVQILQECMQTSSGNTLKIFSPEGQEYLSRNPGAYIALLEQNKTRRGLPSPEQISSYKHYDGYLTPSLAVQCAQILNNCPFRLNKLLLKKYGMKDWQTFAGRYVAGAGVQFKNAEEEHTGFYPVQGIWQDALDLARLVDSDDAFNKNAEAALIARYNGMIENGMKPIAAYGGGHSLGIHQAAAKGNIRLRIIMPPQYENSVRSFLEQPTTSVALAMPFLQTLRSMGLRYKGKLV